MHLFFSKFCIFWPGQASRRSREGTRKEPRQKIAGISRRSCRALPGPQKAPFPKDMDNARIMRARAGAQQARTAGQAGAVY
jgi:hypothetical protein